MKFHYKYLLADGSFFLFEADARPILMEILFNTWRKTVRDPAYLDCNKFLPWLRKKGYCVDEIHPIEIISWIDENQVRR